MMSNNLLDTVSNLLNQSNPNPKGAGALDEEVAWLGGAEAAAVAAPVAAVKSKTATKSKAELRRERAETRKQKHAFAAECIRQGMTDNRIREALDDKFGEALAPVTIAGIRVELQPRAVAAPEKELSVADKRAARARRYADVRKHLAAGMNNYRTNAVITAEHGKGVGNRKIKEIAALMRAEAAREEKITPVALPLDLVADPAPVVAAPVVAAPVVAAVEAPASVQITPPPKDWGEMKPWLKAINAKSFTFVVDGGLTVVVEHHFPEGD